MQNSRLEVKGPLEILLYWEDSIKMNPSEMGFKDTK
jgi:hypothetical protein